jgi:5-methylcytosine-specific restriction endonuclease McrA
METTLANEPIAQSDEDARLAHKRAKARERGRKIRAEDPERQNEIARRFREKNRERLREKKRLFRQTEEGKRVHREEERKRHAKDPERFRALAREWRARPESKQIKLEAGRRWRANNAEKAKIYARLYMRRRRASDPEGNRAAQAAYRANNKEKMRARYRVNDERRKQRVIEDQAFALKRKNLRLRVGAKYRSTEKGKATARHSDINRRAIMFGTTGKFTATDVTVILKLQRGRCAVCRGKLDAKFHRDHIVPLVLGGSNDRRNIQIACGPCNTKKGGKHPIDFMRSRGLLL